MLDNTLRKKRGIVALGLVLQKQIVLMEPNSLSSTETKYFAKMDWISSIQFREFYTQRKIFRLFK